MYIHIYIYIYIYIHIGARLRAARFVALSELLLGGRGWTRVLGRSAQTNIMIIMIITITQIILITTVIVL